MQSWEMRLGSLTRLADLTGIGSHTESEMRETRDYRPTDWIDGRIEIQPSPIHGEGMFAVAPIKQSEIVTIWGGTLILSPLKQLRFWQMQDRDW